MSGSVFTKRWALGLNMKHHIDKFHASEYNVIGEIAFASVSAVDPASQKAFLHGKMQLCASHYNNFLG
jgi:hypothetical protein